jgi:hypothetical protein
MRPDSPSRAPRRRNGRRLRAGRPCVVCDSSGWALKTKARPAHAPWPFSRVVSKLTGESGGGRAARRALGGRCVPCTRLSARRPGFPVARRGLGRRQLAGTDIGHCRRAARRRGAAEPRRASKRCWRTADVPIPCAGCPRAASLARTPSWAITGCAARAATGAPAAQRRACCTPRFTCRLPARGTARARRASLDWDRGPRLRRRASSLSNYRGCVAG